MRMEIKFTKTKDMKYISHLDLFRLFQRAIRRARIPAKLTKGFNPHFKISTKRALKLGVESDEETAYFSIEEETIKPEEIAERLNRQLPEGISIFSARKI